MDAAGINHVRQTLTCPRSIADDLLVIVITGIDWVMNPAGPAEPLSPAYASL
jgi:hypothetical protein